MAAAIKGSKRENLVIIQGGDWNYKTKKRSK